MEYLFEIVLIGVLVFTCIYAIVSRICKCAENCVTTKAMAIAYAKQQKSEESKEE